MQVASIIDKLHEYWNQFQRQFHHTQKELTVVNLMMHLRVEEVEKQDNHTSNGACNKVNFIGTNKSTPRLYYVNPR